jgi:hypothetical protein
VLFDVCCDESNRSDRSVRCFTRAKAADRFHLLMTCAISSEREADTAKDSECSNRQRPLKTGFADVRKKMWADKRETNLTTLLNIFELTIKVFKYLLATSELLQFRHLNEAQASNDEIDLSRETLMKNDW